MTSRLRLENILFSETLAQEPKSPPYSDLFSKNQDLKNAAYVYWIAHVRDGLISIFFHKILRHCSADFVSSFGTLLLPIARWSYRHKIFPKRISRNFNLLSASKWKDAEAENRGLDHWWENNARTIAEFSVVNKLYKDSHISIEGMEHFKAAEKLSKPIIFTSVHIANWEGLFVAVNDGLNCTPIGPFQPEPNRFKNRLIHKIRKERNHYLFPPGQLSAIRLYKLMATKLYSMIIFIDEVRDKQVHLPALGRKLPSNGNAVVAVKIANSCGGIIVPTYMKRVGAADFKMIVLPHVEASADGTYPVEATVQSLNDIFEPIVLDNIQDWYMLAELRLPETFERSPFFEKLQNETKERQNTNPKIAQ